MGWQNYLEVVSRPRIFLSAWPQIDGTGSDDICRVDLLIGALEDTQINLVIGGEVISYIGFTVAIFGVRFSRVLMSPLSGFLKITPFARRQTASSLCQKAKRRLNLEST